MAHQLDVSLAPTLPASRDELPEARQLLGFPIFLPDEQGMEFSPAGEPPSRANDNPILRGME